MPNESVTSLLGEGGSWAWDSLFVASEEPVKSAEAKVGESSQDGFRLPLPSENAFRLGASQCLFTTLTRTPAHFPEFTFEPRGFLEDRN